MTRSFYSYAIFFTALSGLAVFVQSIFYFLLGHQGIIDLSSIRGWIFFILVVSLFSALIMVKYFIYRRYSFALWALVATIVASLFQTAGLYRFFQTREFSLFYAVSVFAVMLTGILYSISLVSSVTKERPWLRAAGIFSFIVGILWLSSVIWALTSVGARTDGTSERIDQWISLFGSFIPIGFIMNFWKERSSAEIRSSSPGTLQTVMNVTALVAVFATPFFALPFISESLWRYRHPDFVWDGARALAAPFEARNYVNNHNDTLRFRLMMPLNYDSTTTYPLVVCLHGSSGRGNDNVRQIGSCIPAALLSNEENRVKYPAFLFVPQCPPNMSWGGTQNTPSVDSLVIQTVLALEKEFSIDVNRRYVAGNSMGGYGTWHLISTHPEMFAAAIPISGGGDPVFAPKITNVPIWVFHGTKDMNVPVSGSQDIIEAIKKAGGNPQYTEYPDKAHDITKEVVSTPGLLEWLFAQKRQ